MLVHMILLLCNCSDISKNIQNCALFRCLMFLLTKSDREIMLRGVTSISISWHWMAARFGFYPNCYYKRFSMLWSFRKCSLCLKCHLSKCIHLLILWRIHDIFSHYHCTQWPGNKVGLSHLPSYREMLSPLCRKSIQRAVCFLPSQMKPLIYSLSNCIQSILLLFHFFLWLFTSELDAAIFQPSAFFASVSSAKTSGWWVYCAFFFFCFWHSAYFDL